MSVTLPEIYAVAAVGWRWVMVAVDDRALPGGRTFARRELHAADMAPRPARRPRESEPKRKLRRSPCMPAAQPTGLFRCLQSLLCRSWQHHWVLRSFSLQVWDFPQCLLVP